MARTPSVNLTTRTARLAEPFGLEWATKLFGAEAVASIPLLQAGPNKGKPRGYVIWRKSDAAGYCREIQSPVANGQLVDAWIGDGQSTPRGEAMAGMWGGRVQPIAASRPYLLEEGQALLARDAAQREEDTARMLAAADRRDAERLRFSNASDADLIKRLNRAENDISPTTMEQEFARMALVDSLANELRQRGVNPWPDDRNAMRARNAGGEG